MRSRLHSRSQPPHELRMGGLQLHCVRQQEFGAGGAKPKLIEALSGSGRAHLRHPQAAFQNQTQRRSELEEGPFILVVEWIVAVLVEKLGHGEYLLFPVE